MSEILYTTQSDDEMIAAGEALAAKLRDGDVLALCGDLGAGKTHFSKGLVAGLGASDFVTSPTFSLVHEYHGGSVPIFHFDFYRLETAAELEQLGWDEYLDERGILLVEWADKFPELLPPATKWYYLRIADDGSHLVTLGEAPAYDSRD